MTASTVSFASLTTKKAKIAHVREMLATSQKWAERGLIRIFENQTEDEQNSGDVVHNNGIGFTGVDAEFLTSLAKQLQSGKTLSPKQMVWVHKKMPKYAKQLVESIAAPVAVETRAPYAQLASDSINFINREAYMPHIPTSLIAAMTVIVCNAQDAASVTAFDMDLAHSTVENVTQEALRAVPDSKLLAFCHDATVEGFDDETGKFRTMTPEQIAL